MHILLIYSHYIIHSPFFISSVQSLSHVWLSATQWIAEHQASLYITNSRSLLKPCPSSWWCHSIISSSVIPFSSNLQSFPASGSFLRSQFFASGGENIGASASSSVFPMNIQDWFPLGQTGLISLQSKGLSRVFSNTTVQKHQFQHSASFMVQLIYPHMTTRKTIALTTDLCPQSNSMLSRSVIAFVPRASIF